MVSKKENILVHPIIYKLALVCLLSAFLTACPGHIHKSKTKVQTSDVMVSEQQQELEVMSPLKYSWDTNYSALLMPPSVLREKARLACNERGFDRAYMNTISLDENVASALFTCRGSDN